MARNCRRISQAFHVVPDYAHHVNFCVELKMRTRGVRADASACMQDSRNRDGAPTQIPGAMQSHTCDVLETEAMRGFLGGTQLL
jgi:hypothetical protein